MAGCRHHVTLHSTEYFWNPCDQLLQLTLPGTSWITTWPIDLTVTVSLSARAAVHEAHFSAPDVGAYPGLTDNIYWLEPTKPHDGVVRQYRLSQPCSLRGFCKSNSGCNSILSTMYMIVSTYVYAFLFSQPSQIICRWLNFRYELTLDHFNFERLPVSSHMYPLVTAVNETIFTSFIIHGMYNCACASWKIWICLEEVDEHGINMP